MSDESKSEESGSKASALINVQVSDLFGLGKLASSPAAAAVVTAVTGAIGGLWSPAGLILNKEAEGFEHRRQTLENAKSAAAVSALYADNPEIAAITQARLLGTEFKRTERIINATKRAAHFADQIEDGAAKHAIDDSFAAEWVEAVKDASDPDIVDMFAQLMARAPTQESGRVPKAVLLLVERMDGDDARLLKLLMAEWLVALPVPARRLRAVLSDDRYQIGLALLRDAGAILASSTAGFNNLALDCEVRTAARQAGRFTMPRPTIECLGPTEAGRQLANLLVGTMVLERPIASFVSNWEQWIPDGASCWVRVREERYFRIRSSEEANPSPVPLYTGPDEPEPALAHWLASLHKVGLFEDIQPSDTEYDPNPFG